MQSETKMNWLNFEVKGHSKNTWSGKHFGRHFVTYLQNSWTCFNKAYHSYYLINMTRMTWSQSQTTFSENAFLWQRPTLTVYHRIISFFLNCVIKPVSCNFALVAKQREMFLCWSALMLLAPVMSVWPALYCSVCYLLMLVFVVFFVVNCNKNCC